jgi:mono/diheme cytochrome c family protein
MKTSFITGLLFALVLSSAPAFAQASNAKPGAAKPGNAENGKKLFTADGCYQCHGRQGQGGSAGPRLAPPKIPVEAIKIYVRHPSGAMPPYTPKVLSDVEIDDIYAFLKTIPAPQPVKDLPLLN